MIFLSETVSQRKTERVTLRLTPEELTYLNYWADKLDVTKTELITQSVSHYVGWIQSDYDIPTALTAQINVLTNAIAAMESSNNNLSKIVISGFDSMLTLSRGDSYLMDPESLRIEGFDGEVDD